MTQKDKRKENELLNTIIDDDIFGIIKKILLKKIIDDIES